MPSVFPTDTRCVTVYVPDDLYYVSQLLGRLHTLSQQIWYNRDEAHTAKDVATLWRNANQQTNDNLINGCNSEKEIKIIEKIINCVTEEIEDTNMPTFQTFNGQLYIGIDCGCGAIDWYPVGPRVQIDPSTNSPLPPSASGIRNGVSYPDVEPGLDCYAQKAVDYLLTRFNQYNQWVTGLSITAIDGALLAADEAFDTIAIVSQLTNGDSVLQAIRDAGLGVVNSAAQSVRGDLIDGWEFTGEVSRPQLANWIIQNTPLTVDGFVLQQAMLNWLANSIIPGYNADLAALASECVTGSSIVNVTSQTIAFQNNDFIVYDLGLPDVELLTQSETYTFQVPDNAISVYWQMKADDATASGWDYQVENGAGTDYPTDGGDVWYGTEIHSGPSSRKSLFVSAGATVGEELTERVANVVFDGEFEITALNGTASTYPAVFKRFYCVVAK